MSIRWNSGNGNGHDTKPKGQMFGRQSNKQWIHPPDGLVKGHVVYKVKFLGECEVDQAKGTEIVKEGIRKMKFNKQVKKAEGQKLPKVELSISVDGIEVFDIKTKRTLYKFPIHRISYCADDKSDKRMFSFIAKQSESDKHKCLVFDSEKCAEEITLTVGQGFDLAYRRFLDSSGKDSTVKQQVLTLQKKLNEMHEENLRLKSRICDLERLKDANDLEQYIKHHQAMTRLIPEPRIHSMHCDIEDEKILNNDIAIAPLALKEPYKIVRLTDIPVGKSAENGHTETAPLSTSPPNFSTRTSSTLSSDGPIVGRRLENLLFDDFDEIHFDEITVKPRANSSSISYGDAPAILPPPANPRSGSMRSSSMTIPEKTVPLPSHSQQTMDIFGSVPFNDTGNANTSSDAFGMAAFSPLTSKPSDQQGYSERELMDLQFGFSQGLSFGTDDFSLDSLDPLKK